MSALYLEIPWYNVLGNKWVYCTWQYLGIMYLAINGCTVLDNTWVVITATLNTGPGWRSWEGG